MENAIHFPRPGFALVIVLISLFCSPGRAAETVAKLRPEFKYPLIYSTGLMALYYPVLLGAGVFDSGPSVNNFERAFTSAPRWDDDSPFFNFVLHPLWGSETYLRARESHFGIPGSIAFSMGMSVTWEYLYESWAQRPSTQDLIFTTGIGWTLGELRYRLKQRASDQMDWFLDPIEKTLEHFHIVAGRDDQGNMSAGFAFSLRF